jgi:hypothetical protein
MHTQFIIKQSDISALFGLRDSLNKQPCLWQSYMLIENTVYTVALFGARGFFHTKQRTKAGTVSVE